MSPTPTALLGLVLCLGPAIQAQQGNLPRPSISAKPDSVIPWGMSVTFVCQGPLGVEVFLLEKDGKPDSFPDVMNSLVTETEARFPIGSVKKDTAGRYNCIYFIGNASSERSEFLELVVTGDPSDISPSPTEAGFQTEAADTTSPSKHKPDFKSVCSVISWNAELGMKHRIVFLRQV
ncbi:leukocyte-associated immunoglobulin-like receptor 1 isoform X10 [Loxodonta africana]|uniref:leukocyte-associated immunoglobulin-like receptor 1 isoform X10 n=1 Tax=Loxodonta africana TaxID=9785 RepID=UPI0030D43ED1